MVAFGEMTTDQQIEDLLPVAHEVISRYDIGTCTVESINHGYNSTFKVTSADGQQFALRINVNSVRTPANTLAELSWISELTEHHHIDVPTPLLTTSGEALTQIFHASSNRELTSVMYTWLDGEDLGDEPELEQLEALGATMAHMHEQSVHFALPDDADLPIFSDVLWNTRNCLLSDDSEIAPDEQVVVRLAFSEIQKVMDSLFAHTPPQIIHADLHGWNVKWHNGRLSVFDFDDCGFGLPVQDLSTTLYYLDTEEQDNAVKRGYETVRPLPTHTEREMQTLLLQRRILLSNYLFETTNPEHRAMAPDYFRQTLTRVNKYLYG